MGPVRLVQSGADDVQATEALPAETEAAAAGGLGGFLSNATLPGILFAGSIMLIVVVLMRHARKQRSRVQERTERPVIARTGIADAAARDEVHAVVADAADLTRELAAAVETKAARLESLLQQADERIARLEAGLERGGSAEAGPDVRTSVPAEIDRPRVTDRGAVVSMVDDGSTDNEIARATGVAIGEVELIRRLHAASGADGGNDTEAGHNGAARSADRPADARSLDAYLAALVSDEGGTRPRGAS